MKLNNISIREAVSAWISNQKEAEVAYGHISSWDTSGVTDMSKLFLDAADFNDPIGSWDVSNVTTMHAMFDNAIEFNQPLGKWNISNAETLAYMFSGAIKFNQPIGSWDVSKVNDFSGMFRFAHDFNQNINEWDVSNGSDFHNMFHYALSFNSPVDKWNVSKGINFSGMFDSAKAFNQPMNTWEITIPRDKSWNMIIHGFDDFLLNAISFNQNIKDWIEKYQIVGMDGDPFRGVKSITGKKSPKPKIINLKPTKKKELLNRLTKLVDSYKDSNGFKFINVEVILGDDFSEHPAIRDQDKVLSFHKSYQYSYENISWFAIAPSCFFTIEVGAETFTIIYLNVGIEDQWEDCEVFLGITSETMKPSFTTSFMRENILWFHEIKAPEQKLVDKLTTIGEVLTDEDASVNVFGFFDTYPGIPEIEISWDSIDNIDW